jgi:hypothetical protein
VKGLNNYRVVRMLIFSAMIGLQSCEEKKETGILSEKEMVRILTEIYITEDKVNRLALGPDTSRQIFQKMKGKIELKTGVPDSVFMRSLEYYSRRPEQMENIYTALVDSLNLKEQRVPAGPAR